MYSVATFTTLSKELCSFAIDDNFFDHLILLVLSFPETNDGICQLSLEAFFSTCELDII